MEMALKSNSFMDLTINEAEELTGGCGWCVTQALIGCGGITAGGCAIIATAGASLPMSIEMISLGWDILMNINCKA